MKVSDNAYSLLEEKLQRIENTAVDGILQKDARDCCMEIRNLVFETRQIIKNEFYLEHKDGRLPPAA
ncbi:hypothetical protein V1L52_10160 [Treponema sp. HNW]|uniref:hypothetical protein n=1 Tax=Treponema sp. HNW TaxID=3116654 RepID=UPI003D0DD3B8